MTRLRAVLAAVVSAAAIAMGATLVSAHAQYSSSTPASNATVNAAPTTVTVTWTQELASIQFTITGPDGSNVVTGPAKINLEERHTVSVPIRDGGPGQYLVLWHNVSGDDGDPNDGSFVFTVAVPAPQPATAPAGPTTPNPAPAAANPQSVAVITHPVSAQGCIDIGILTPGIADARVNTYCKRQAIREQYKGKINELVFNYDLSIGMGLESSLKDAMGGGG